VVAAYAESGHPDAGATERSQRYLAGTTLDLLAPISSPMGAEGNRGAEHSRCADEIATRRIAWCVGRPIEGLVVHRLS